VTHPGKYTRSGPRKVLVTKDSATGGRCYSHPHLTIQVDENHSAMVKFTPGDFRIRIISSKLADICGVPRTTDLRDAPVAAEERSSSYEEPKGEPQSTPTWTAIPDPLEWDDDCERPLVNRTSGQSR
jgi:hypothetical protein